MLLHMGKLKWGTSWIHLFIISLSGANWNDILISNLLQWNSPGSTKEHKTDQQVKKKEITICALEDIMILLLILVGGHVAYICKFLMAGT